MPAKAKTSRTVKNRAYNKFIKDKDIRKREQVVPMYVFLSEVFSNKLFFEYIAPKSVSLTNFMLALPGLIEACRFTVTVSSNNVENVTSWEVGPEVNLSTIKIPLPKGAKVSFSLTAEVDFQVSNVNFSFDRVH